MVNGNPGAWPGAVPPAPEPDARSAGLQRLRLDSLLKPRGALGSLEDLLARLAAVTGRCLGATDRPGGGTKFAKLAVVAASDHGVVAEGVSPYPSWVTGQVLRSAMLGKAAISVACRAARASLILLDMGVVGGMEPERPNGAMLAPAGEWAPAVIAGYRGPTPTGNIALGPAMGPDEALEALRAGQAAVREHLRGANPLLILGEVGIGNTTVASALCAALLGARPEDVVGPGSGADTDTLRRKVRVVRRALDANRPDPARPLDVLAKVGGREIAALCGCCIEGAAMRVPVILDGFVCSVAGLVASRMVPGVEHCFFASHLSPEPGHAVVLASLGLSPLLHAGLRLGEGLGGLLFASILETGVTLVEEMGTLQEIGLTGADSLPAASPSRPRGAGEEP